MRKKILFALCLLEGLFFINAGLNKFFNYMPAPEDLPKAQVDMFVAMMQIGWLLPLIATAEIIGGILFMFPRLRPLGALILCPVLTGIVIAHIAVAPETLGMALIFAAVWLWSVIEDRRRYLPLISPA